jgi:hypothetical protein
MRMGHVTHRDQLGKPAHLMSLISERHQDAAS